MAFIYMLVASCAAAALGNHFWADAPLTCMLAVLVPSSFIGFTLGVITAWFVSRTQ